MNDMSTTGGAHERSGAKSSMSHGEVRKVDAAAGKLTIRHGPLENLGMGPMTMVFKVNARRCCLRSRWATASTSWRRNATAHSPWRIYTSS